MADVPLDRLPIPPLREIEIEIDRRECRDFRTFVKRAWPILEPATDLKWGWVLDAVCDHLVAVSEGQTTNLLMNVPPGSMKSLLTGVLWNAWEWGPCGKPERRFLSTAHKQELAIRDTMKTRRLIQSDWFQERWPTPLVSDNNQKMRFENSATGFREAMAFTSMTGSRGDCLLAGSLVLTDIGEIPIEDIVDAALPCNVLSYDEHSERVVYRPVEAVARRSSRDFYRVHFAGGGMVECTGDHRFYTTRGYVEARLLSGDDVLLRAVRNAGSAERLRDEEGGEGRPRQADVQPALQPDHVEPCARKLRPVVQHLRGQDPEREAAVFGGLREDRAGEEGRVEEGRTSAHSMRSVQQNISAEDFGEETAVLLPPLPSDGSFPCDARGGKSGVAQWHEREEVYQPFASAVPQDQGQDRGTGRGSLRRLQDNGRPLRAPYRHGPGEQCLAQPGDALQGLPRDLAREGAIEVTRETVALVERVCEPTVVYDIQVEGTRCFFANGVLVHNCVILDDPHSVDDANSVAKLAGDITTFREALPSRVNNDKSAIVIIMQRLNEADVSAVAIELGYDHLCIPMRYERGRSKWFVGAGDPRTVEGELMFPERFPEEQVEKLERTMGSYAVAGQLQQRPAPRGGGIIKTAWFGSYDALPNLEWRTIYADTAQKTGQENDYSVFECWGRTDTGQAVLIDLLRGKWEAPDLLAEARKFWLKHQAAHHSPLRAMKVEDKVSGTGLIQTLRREGIPILPIQRHRDKTTRAYDAAPFIEAGNVLLPSWAEWLDAFLAEVATFPSGANDDQLDPMFDAIADVQFNPPTRRPAPVNITPMAFGRA